MVEKFAIGQGVSRLEDPRLLRGAGRYLDMPLTAERVWRAIAEAIRGAKSETGASDD